MTDNYTPRPWIATGYIIREKSPRAGYIARVESIPKKWNRGDGLSNARLISASPDLLEAARRAEDVLTETIDAIKDDVTVEVIDELDTLLRQFRAAIDKATETGGF